MKVLKEIAEHIGAADGMRVSCTVLDGSGGYFQNVRRILEFFPDHIVLGGRRGRVRVEGEGLTLGKCYKGDVTVRGKIVRVEREE